MVEIVTVVSLGLIGYVIVICLLIITILMLFNSILGITKWLKKLISK